MLQMFGATIAMQKVIMHRILQSKEFRILSTLCKKYCLQRRMKLELFFPTNKMIFSLLMLLKMEEIEELSANICMMARIQPTNIDSNKGPSYDSAFISEVQTPSTSFMNMLFSNSHHEQTYHEQPQIINSTTVDDQINSNIIFDDLNVEVDDGSVEHDKNAHDSYDNKLEQLARNAYKEAEKQQIIA
ncbi:hypothetical protein Tco_0655125 [Tanacetum coccineum]|uniref:Uncharacterized protein n=1 Tax=Tanacetum coccineum TaxID=301880 RepID=A0ABQ4X561_9ASTR